MTDLEPKKLAVLRIWQILKEYSDCDHPMTQEDIANKLESEYGIVLERKAIGRNISLLKESGVEIESGRNGSYLSVREFEDSELRLLIDSVLSSKQITQKYSKDLIDKICGLSNKYFRTGVQHIHSVKDWNKTNNKELFYNIETVDKAIESRKQIHYYYNKYGEDKQLHRTTKNRVSPYAMILHNQKYYLMAYHEYWHKMVFHRLDHITNMIITERIETKIRDVPGYENGIDYKEFSSSMPYMYSDKPERIEFLADKDIIDQIIDWFGTDIYILKTGIEKKVKVIIKASPNAMVFWALQYVDHVEVTAPESLRNRIKEALENGLKKYQ